MIRRYDCGIVTGRSAPEEFAAALEALGERSVWQRKSANAKKMVREEYLWSNLLKPLDALYAGWGKGAAAGERKSHAA